jgi:TatA/E family protein of Tat protein translocase
VIGDILQPTHLIFILAVALLVLGPKRLPEVGRSLGRGLRDFKSALNMDDDQSPSHEAHAAPRSLHEAPPEPVHEPAAEPVHEPAMPEMDEQPAEATPAEATPAARGSAEHAG